MWFVYVCVHLSNKSVECDQLYLVQEINIATVSFAPLYSRWVTSPQGSGNHFVTQGSVFQTVSVCVCSYKKFFAASFDPNSTEVKLKA